MTAIVDGEYSAQADISALPCMGKPSDLFISEMVAITHGKGGSKPDEGQVSAIYWAEDSHAPFLRIQRHAGAAVEDVDLIAGNTCLEHGAV
ncbi:hypothetical protein ACC679_38010, partial [Rhizobium ruizarguesonis]